MLRAYVTDPDTSVETAYTAFLRADKAMEIGVKAFNGEADLGDVLLDDPAGTLDWAIDFGGHRRVRLTEDASGSELTIFVGRIASKEYERGTFVADRGREFTITLEDANADLRGIPVHSWVRPAETGYARVLALVPAYLNGASSTALDPEGNPWGRGSTVIGTAFVQNAGNVSMPAETYTGTDPLAVIRACAEWENKAAFVYTNDDGSLDLYYAPKAETSQLNCTLAVSDDPADVDFATVFEPHWSAGPALHTDTDEVVSGLLLIHPDGVTYERRTAAETVHDRWEEAVYSTRPKAQGTSEITALLDARQLEQPRRQFAIELPAESVHLVKAGMRIEIIQARASVIDASTFLRIVNVRYAWRSPGVDGSFYTVIISLETPIKLGATWPRSSPNPVVAGGQPIYGGGGSDTEFFATFRVYLTPLSDVTLVAVWEGLAWAGVLFIAGDVGHAGTPTFQGYVLPENTPTGVLSTDPISAPAFHVVTIGVTGTTRYVTLDGILNTISLVGSEWPPYLGGGAGTGNVAIRVVNNNPGGVDATQRLEVDSITGVGVIDSFNRVNASDWGPDWTATGAAPFWNVDGSVGTIYNNPDWVELIVSTSALGPQGTTVIGATGHDFTYITTADGSTDAWVFPYPYASGSLRVWVDGNLQNATEDDPGTGAFSLSWMPASGDQIKAIARVL